MTQVAFAEAIGVPVATLRNWEQGRVAPDPAARALLRILDREPEAALRALATVRPKQKQEYSAILDKSFKKYNRKLQKN